MIQHKMTYLYIFLVSAAASFDIGHIKPIFMDVIFLMILFFGIIMSLTLDHNRPDVTRKMTVGYVLFSFSSSVFFSAMTIAAYVEFDFKKFYLYVLIGVTATMAPQFARKVLPEAPAELKKGAFSLLSAFFSGMAKKLNPDHTNNDIKKEENDTE